MNRLFFIIVLFLAACITPKKQDPTEDLPIPSGRTFITDEDGVASSTLTAKAVYDGSGEQAVDISAGELTGVAFDMVAEATPEITVTSDSSTPFRVLIYGPQDELGLWGDHLRIAYGESRAVIGDWTAPKNGHYLLLVQPLVAVSFAYTVDIACAACDLNPCETSMPCNLYCPRGRAIDASSGCFQCECAGAGCVTDGCANDGDLCVTVCGDQRCALDQACISGQCEANNCEASCELGETCVDGVCMVAQHECMPESELCEQGCSPAYQPVCGEQSGQARTFRNACLAECSGVTEFTDGECDRGCVAADDCSEGQICIQGDCVRDPSCGCDTNLTRPVCGSKDGVRKTFKNECQMRCEGYEVEHPGRCIDQPRCDTNLDCRTSDRCVTVSDSIVAGNQARCAENPRAAGCVRACLPRPRCERDDDCPNDHQCMPFTGGGLCVPSCVDRTSGCDASEVCVNGLLNRPDDRVRRPGICVTGCGEGGDCNAGLSCVDGLAACLPCDACEALPTTHICDDGVAYENTCFQLCSQPRFSLSDSEAGSDLEICNGIDDDCDGETDENLVRDCRANREMCADGIQRCVDGQWSRCEQIPQDVREECNGVDDDCDGRVDEVAARSCETASNTCPVGTQSCIRGRWTSCEPVELDIRDECNGKDDDCDGSIDEDGDPDRDTRECGGCDLCPTDWSPVCTDYGLVPNRCFLQCYGLDEKPMELCGEAALQVRRCTSDRDCALSECPDGQGVCGHLGDRGCGEYSEAGQCYERFASCGCDTALGLCNFTPNSEVVECLDRASVPPRQPEPDTPDSMR